MQKPTGVRLCFSNALLLISLGVAGAWPSPTLCWPLLATSSPVSAAPLAPALAPCAILSTAGAPPGPAGSLPLPAPITRTSSTHPSSLSPASSFLRRRLMTHTFSPSPAIPSRLPAGILPPAPLEVFVLSSHPFAGKYSQKIMFHFETDLKQSFLLQRPQKPLQPIGNLPKIGASKQRKGRSFFILSQTFELPWGA